MGAYVCMYAVEGTTNLLEIQIKPSSEVRLRGIQCLYLSTYLSIYVSIYLYLLGAKYGFAQSMDCAVQTMDLYFVWAIHGLRVHVRLNILYLACIDQLVLHLRPVVYPRTGPASKPDSL